MKSYSVISLSIAIISTLAMHNSNCQNSLNDIDFDIKKGIQFAAIPIIHHTLIPSQPLIQSAIATGGFYFTENAAAHIVREVDNEVESYYKRKLHRQAGLARNISYFVGNYASRKLAYTMRESNYQKYVISQSENMTNMLPEKVLGYEIRENIRPITQKSLEIASHPLFQELAFHAVGSLIVKQCTDYMTLNN